MMNVLYLMLIFLKQTKKNHDVLPTVQTLVTTIQECPYSSPCTKSVKTIHTKIEIQNCII